MHIRLVIKTDVALVKGQELYKEMLCSLIITSNRRSTWYKLTSPATNLKF